MSSSVCGCALETSERCEQLPPHSRLNQCVSLHNTSDDVTQTVLSLILLCECECVCVRALHTNMENQIGIEKGRVFSLLNDRSPSIYKNLNGKTLQPLHKMTFEARTICFFVFKGLKPHTSRNMF